MTEVVAPYKQNWIGLISVTVIVLAAIVTNFPELLENPSISFPDLDAGEPIEQVPDSLRMEGYSIEAIETRVEFFALKVRRPLSR